MTTPREEWENNFVTNIDKDKYICFTDENFMKAIQDDKVLAKKLGPEFDEKVKKFNPKMGSNHISQILDALYKLLDKKLNKSEFNESLKNYKLYLKDYFNGYIQAIREESGVTNEGDHIIIFPENFETIEDGISMEYLDKSLEEIKNENDWEGDNVFICTKRDDNTYKIQYKSIFLKKSDTEGESKSDSDEHSNTDSENINTD
jgi:hypothetical protein